METALSNLLQLGVAVCGVAVVWMDRRCRRLKQELRKSLEGWERQLCQTQILRAIERAHADYMVEETDQDKPETARQLIRDRVENDGRGRPETALISRSAIAKQRGLIRDTRLKYGFPRGLVDWPGSASR